MKTWTDMSIVERREAWTTALLSGKFVQGRGKLKRVSAVTRKVSHCCLGVLCEVAAEHGADIVVINGSSSESCDCPECSGSVNFKDNRDGYSSLFRIGPALEADVGLNGGSQSCLAVMNDKLGQNNVPVNNFAAIAEQIKTIPIKFAT